MKKEKVEGCCLPCEGVQTRDWYSWINLMPPPPNEFHVVGEVYVPNPGVEPLLVPKVPQGINPSILLLDLYLCQRPGVWPRAFVWKPVRYEKIVRDQKYTQVQVFCGDEVIADIPVEEIR
ncbi:MAG: hypothetical protein AAGD06_22770 [Acidobacteriota bacterium]